MNEAVWFHQLRGWRNRRGGFEVKLVESQPITSLRHPLRGPQKLVTRNPRRGLLYCQEEATRGQTDPRRLGGTLGKWAGAGVAISRR